MATNVEDPQNYSLKAEDCRARGERALYAGEFVEIAFQYLTDDGSDAIDIDGYAIVFTFTDCQGETFTRTTGVTLDGHPTLDQVEIDNQSTGSATAATGKGWFRAYLSQTEDLASSGTYKAVLTPPTDRPFSLVRGEYEIVE